MEGLGLKKVVMESSGMDGTSKQGGWVPDILEVKSNGERCPRAFLRVSFYEDRSFE